MSAELHYGMPASECAHWQTCCFDDVRHDISHPPILPIITTLAQSLRQQRFLILPNLRNTCPKLRHSRKLRTAAPVRTKSLLWVIMPVHKNWTRIQKFFSTRGPCIKSGAWINVTFLCSVVFVDGQEELWQTHFVISNAVCKLYVIFEILLVDMLLYLSV